MGAFSPRGLPARLFARLPRLIKEGFAPEVLVELSRKPHTHLLAYLLVDLSTAAHLVVMKLVVHLQAKNEVIRCKSQRIVDTPKALSGYFVLFYSSSPR